MSKFQKVPVVVEATQWFKNGDHPQDFSGPRAGYENGVLRTYTGDYARARDWEGAVVRRYNRPDCPRSAFCSFCGFETGDHGWLENREGGHRVCPGDWIITGPEDQYQLCKPSVFARAYVSVEEKGEVAHSLTARGSGLWLNLEDGTVKTSINLLAEGHRYGPMVTKCLLGVRDALLPPPVVVDPKPQEPQPSRCRDCQEFVGGFCNDHNDRPTCAYFVRRKS